MKVRMNAMSKKKKAELETKEELLYRVCQDFPEEGVKFIDLTPSIIDVNSRMCVLSNMVNHIENEVQNVDIIISPDARGFLWGMGVASLMNCSLIPIRKSGKLPETCILDTVTYDTEYSSTSLDLPISDLEGKRVMFVDDVYATGGTYNACKTLVEKAGGIMAGATVIYDVGLSEEQDADVYSIYRGEL